MWEGVTENMPERRSETTDNNHVMSCEANNIRDLCRIRS